MGNVYPIETYTQSIADDNPYEGRFNGEEKPVFPHDLPILKSLNKGYDLIKVAAFGNDLTNDLQWLQYWEKTQVK